MCSQTYIEPTPTLPDDLREVDEYARMMKCLNQNIHHAPHLYAVLELAAANVHSKSLTMPVHGVLMPLETYLSLVIVAGAIADGETAARADRQ